MSCVSVVGLGKMRMRIGYWIGSEKLFLIG